MKKQKLKLDPDLLIRLFKYRRPMSFNIEMNNSQYFLWYWSMFMYLSDKSLTITFIYNNSRGRFIREMSKDFVKLGYWKDIGNDRHSLLKLNKPIEVIMQTHIVNK